MTMTRKHYEAVAKILYDFQKEIEQTLADPDFDSEDFIYDFGTGEATRDLAVKFADLFQADNPKFNRLRFFEATDTETDN